MKRINFTVVVCLTFSVFSPFLIKAEDVLKECNPSGTTVMIIGDIVACTIDPVADSDFFTFSGRDGETVMLTLTETGGDYYPAPYLEFFDPDDERIDQWYAQNTGVSRQFKLTQTGTYTVLVHEWQDDQTVSYNLGLSCISGVCPPCPPYPLAEIIGTWSSGIRYWDVAESSWNQMWPTPPDGEDIAAGDFTGDGRADVASIWDNELYYQDGATLAWTRVPGTAPDSLTAGDVTGDGLSLIHISEPTRPTT